MTDRSAAPELPLSYRRQEVAFLYDCLRGGESCCVLGVSGSGKSNFARFVVRPDVRAAYLGEGTGRFAVVLVDSHSLDVTASLEQRVYELMLHRLLLAAQLLRVDPAVLAPLEDHYERLLNSPSPLLGLRYLERCLAALIEGEGLRVAFVCDEFDDVVRDADRQLFRSLRGLRDQHKYALTYVLLLRDPLEALRGDPAELEAFAELVALHTTALGGYSREDAADALQRLAARWRCAVPGSATVDTLWRLTGGHPGLLRAAFDALATDRIRPEGLTIPALVDDEQVALECRKLWSSLPQAERQALSMIAGGFDDGVPGAAARSLIQKRLLAPGDGAVTPTSPVFAAFVAGQPASNEGLVYDALSQRVFVDGREVNLAPSEFALLGYLHDRRGQVCSRDDLIGHIYGDEAQAAGVTDNQLDLIVSRLRRRIEPDRRHPRFVLNVRGRGFRLAD